MTRNQKSLVFVASGGTYDEAATQFKRTRGVGAGVCHRAGLKVGTRYPDRNRDNGRRQMESLRTRAHCDPILRAKWITAINDGRASWRDGRTAPYNVRGSIAHGSEHRRNRLRFVTSIMAKVWHEALRLILVSFLLALSIERTFAIDLQPGDVKPLKPGTDFGQISFRFSSYDGLYLNGEKQSSYDGDSARYQIRLGHFFEILNLPAVGYVQTGLANIQSDQGMGKAGTDAGIEDTVALLALWPYADHDSQTYLGIGVYGLLPTGSYDNDLGAFNIGENRYWTALQTAFQTKLCQRFIFMTALDGIWFSTNPDFAPAHLELDQKPLYSAQVAFTYEMADALTLSANYFYTWGGETLIDGIPQDNANELHRYQVSAVAALPVGRLMLQYGGDLQRKTGLFEVSRFNIRLVQVY